MVFSESFTYILILASLGIIAVASVALLWMVIKDIKNKKVW